MFPLEFFSFLFDCLLFAVYLHRLFSSLRGLGVPTCLPLPALMLGCTSPLRSGMTFCVTSLLDSNVLFLLFDANVVGMRELLIS